MGASSTPLGLLLGRTGLQKVIMEVLHVGQGTAGLQLILLLGELYVSLWGSPTPLPAAKEGMQRPAWKALS